VSEKSEWNAPAPSNVRGVELTPERCYEALKARDARFDGLFFVGVASTGIYCRPVCTARVPRYENCTFYRHPAAAEEAGYRPCLKCRPELAPGSAPVDAVQRVARLAAAQIQSGALTDSNLETLARSLGVSSRQLRRAVRREYGVSPVALAQTHRLLLAKQLLSDTRLPVTEIAFASGFGSLSRFNRSFRTRYQLSPSQLRNGHRALADQPGIALRLAYRPPLAWTELISFLAARGSHRTERREGERYLRTLRVGSRKGWIAAQPLPGRDELRVEIAPALVSELGGVLPALRRLFDLDANPEVISTSLARDPALKASVLRAPGLRVPGAVSGFEVALRAILGQQVSVKAATTLYTRLVDAYGTPVQTPFPGLNRVAPGAPELAEVRPARLAALGLTRPRAEAIIHLAGAVASGALVLELGRDPAAAVAQLLELPGFGEWTARYVAMRALGDPDSFPFGDLGLRRALAVNRAADVLARSEAWRPWRAYAAMQLWNGNRGG
jgi:AraC family transcriptional regulator of adaptative response / DNA-3-methyladenine glycosylase II